MTDVRTRLADALREHSCLSEDFALTLADVLLSLPDISIVEVPSPAYDGDGPWPGDAVLGAWR